MSDSRDTNHDGKVSLMEKVKDKLHLGHKDHDTTYTSTHHTTTAALPATHTTTAALPVAGVASMPVAAVAAMPVASTMPLASGYTTQSAYQTSSIADSRDLNRDGHVSMGEKLATAGATHGSYSSTTGSVADSRDLNRDGHVSMGEKLATAGAAHGSYVNTTGSIHDSRDLNRDGHVSMGEKLLANKDEASLVLHEEQLAISKREVGAGEVGIHKRVEAERVEQTVALRREEVIVERRPLSGIADPNARIMEQDEILRVPLHREEVIMEKRVVPTEEVIVRKKDVIENQTVGATLRSEYVDTVQTQAISQNASLTGGYADSRDLNRDGHVSMGEKLKSATGSHATTGAYTDSRDLNRDGHVSLKEKADLNKDGHVSAGEGIRAASNMKAARG